MMLEPRGRRTHRPPSLTCNVCFQNFARLAKLKQHILNEDDPQHRQEFEDNVGKSNCESCKQQFKNSAGYRRHASAYTVKRFVAQLESSARNLEHVSNLAIREVLQCQALAQPLLDRVVVNDTTMTERWAIHLQKHFDFNQFSTQNYSAQDFIMGIWCLVLRDVSQISEGYLAIIMLQRAHFLDLTGHTVHLNLTGHSGLGHLKAELLGLRHVRRVAEATLPLFQNIRKSLASKNITNPKEILELEDIPGLESNNGHAEKENEGLPNSLPDTQMEITSKETEPPLSCQAGNIIGVHFAPSKFNLIPYNPGDFNTYDSCELSNNFNVLAYNRLPFVPEIWSQCGALVW